MPGRCHRWTGQRCELGPGAGAGGRAAGRVGLLIWLWAGPSPAGLCPGPVLWLDPPCSPGWPSGPGRKRRQGTVWEPRYQPHVTPVNLRAWNHPEARAGSGGKVATSCQLWAVCQGSGGQALPPRRAAQTSRGPGQRLVSQVGSGVGRPWEVVPRQQPPDLASDPGSTRLGSGFLTGRLSGSREPGGGRSDRGSGRCEASPGGSRWLCVPPLQRRGLSEEAHRARKESSRWGRTPSVRVFSFSLACPRQATAGGLGSESGGRGHLGTGDTIQLTRTDTALFTSPDLIRDARKPS